MKKKILCRAITTLGVAAAALFLFPSCTGGGGVAAVTLGFAALGGRGTLHKYVRLVRSASEGCVTDA